MVFATAGNNGATVLAEISMTNGPVPLAINTAASVTYTPGAFTKLVMDLKHTKAGTDSPDVYALKPGFENNASAINKSTSLDWTGANSAETAMPFATMGTVIDCFGFRGAGGQELNIEAID